MSTFNASSASDMRKMARKMGLSFDVVVRKSLLDLSSNIIKGTPVDTGRARANWAASIGSPSTETTGTIDKSGSKTAASANNVIADATGDVYYLTNNLPYIKALEYGHSKQAPQGFVRLAVAGFVDFVKQAIKEN